MIYVSTEVGSKEFEKPLQRLGLPVEKSQMKFGDIAFESKGGLMVGIEFKNLADFIGSSVTTTRLQGHQLGGMLTTYQRPYLFIEGEWRSDAAGRVVVEKIRRGQHEWVTLPGAPPAVELESRILTLSTRGGLTVRETNTRPDTLRRILALYRFWTDKALGDHTSHLALHQPDLDTSLLRPATQAMRTLATLPGVGLKVARAADEYFQGDVERAIRASAETWAALTTTDKQGRQRRFGMKAAEELKASLRRKV